jgi:hypothetical protein
MFILSVSLFVAAVLIDGCRDIAASATDAGSLCSRERREDTGGDGQTFLKSEVKRIYAGKAH